MNFKFFEVIKSPTDELLEILNKNIIGTPGYGMLYQHKGVFNKIYKIADPTFINLIRNNKIIGTCCFCSRTTSNSGKQISSFYIRYFSFMDKYRRKQINDKISNRKSSLRDEILNILSGKGLIENTNDKFYHYAYVDPRNLRSALLCKEFGFEPVRKFSTLIFNRLNPKEDKRVIEISSAQVSEVKELLRNFYLGYNMFSFENLFNSRKYYIVKDNSGKILAGVQAEPDNWEIHEMPGVSGKIILEVFSILPVFKKLINKHYRFLTLEGIYHAPGCEKYLEILIESLLAKHKVNSAMIWVDRGASLYKSLRSLNLGIVDKLNKEVKADVICRFIHFDNEEKRVFRENPAYISGIDLT